MKYRNFIGIICFVMMTGVFFSCSSDEDGLDYGGEVPVDIPPAPISYDGTDGAANIILSDSVDWMRFIGDDRLLSQISLPGTHDSGSKGLGIFAETQGNDIAEQLMNGIRCFDIRMNPDRTSSKLKICHGSMNTDLTFEEDVMPVFVRFLKEHPSETLVVFMKKDAGDAGPYKEFIETELTRKENVPYILKDFRDSLRLRDCRGKILFLHREPLQLYIGAECSSWKNNATDFLSPDNGKTGVKTYLYYEDKYENISVEEKKEEVIRHLQEAATDQNSNHWYFTFVSVSIMFPSYGASFLNKPLGMYIYSLENKPYGVVLLDFANSEEGKLLADAVIDSNCW